MKKGLIILLTIIGILLIIALIFLINNKPLCRTPYIVKDNQTNECKIVIDCSPPKNIVTDDSCIALLIPQVNGELDNSVKLYLNQTLNIKNEDLKIKIVGFANSPCPEGEKCFWSGIGIFYEITTNNETKRYTSELGSAITVSEYQIIVNQTDYKNYAILHVITA